MYWRYSHQFFVDLLKKIAPERGMELDALIKQHGIVFIVDDKSEYHRIEAHPESKEIIVGIRSEARLWAYAYSYLGIYDGLAKTNGKGTDTALSGLTQKNKKFFLLLNWATTEDIESLKAKEVYFERTPVPIPSNVPEPFVRAGSKLADVAGGLALLSLGYILLHEIAHLFLGHKKCEGLDAIRNEKDADIWAAEWIMSSSDPDSGERQNRLMGIATGLLWLMTFEIYFGPKDSRIHPPTYDRLYQVLDRIVLSEGGGLDSEEHLVWSFVQMSMAFHMGRAGIELPKKGKFPTYKELVNYYIDTISKLPKKQT